MAKKSPPNSTSKVAKNKPQLADKARLPKPGIPIPKEKIIELIHSEGGNLSRVADILGTTRHCIRRRADDDEEINTALIDARERKVDILEESCFDRAIRTNDTGLQCFLLKTQGRARGYDQSEDRNNAKEIANAAFSFILNKTTNA